MKNRSFYILISLVFISVLGGLKLLPLSNPYIALSFAFITFIYLPGHLLLKIFFSDNTFDLIEYIPAVFCLGYVFYMPFALSGYLFHLKLASFINVYIAFLVALLFLAVYLKRHLGFAFITNPSMKPYVWLIFSIVILVSVMMADYFGGFTSGNFLVHVSTIRKIFELGIIKQESCYFKGILCNPNMYNIYHVFLAVVSRLSGIDPVKIWIYLPMFVLPVGLIANFAFARSMFKENKPAVIYLLIYFIYKCIYNANSPADGAAWWHSENSAANNYTAMGIFLPMVFVMVFKYMSSGEKKILVFTALFLLAEGAIHLYVQAQTYFIFFSIFAFGYIFKPRGMDIKRLKTAFFVSLSALVFFFAVYLTLQPNINPAYMKFGGTGLNISIIHFGKWLIADPSGTILKDPYVITSSVIFFISLFYLRNSQAIMYVSSVFFMVFFILFNPLIMYLGGLVHPPYERITRLYNIIPFSLALALPFSGEFRPFSSFKIVKHVIVLFVIAGTFLILKNSPERLKKIVYTKKYSLNQFSVNEKTYQLIRKAIPKGSIVMINLRYSTWWTTYFPHYIIAHVFDFVLAPNIDQTERKNDVNYYYGNKYGKESYDILNKYGADYVFYAGDEANTLDGNKHGLSAVFVSSQIQIYKVFKNLK